MLIKNGVLNRLTWIPLLLFLNDANVLQKRCRILNVDLRPVAVGERVDQLLWVKMTDFMKFGGTDTGTQGTLGHHLLYD